MEQIGTCILQKTNKDEKDFYVTGIGASAGGVKALTTFFDNMPQTKNMAFIIIQHLNPSHDGLTADVISRHTSMEVSQAAEGMVIEPNNVYIIPPNKYLRVEDNLLHVCQLEDDEKPRYSTDILFKSLAKNYMDKSIAIILSGASGDEAMGCKVIKKLGGMVMVQDEITAKFTSMPHNIVMAELFDFILPPESMGKQLVNYVKNSTETDMVKEQSYNNIIEVIEGEEIESISIAKRIDKRNKYLEMELKQTREALQTTLEEVETLKEELQSTKEKLLASNKELQMTIEEFQSAKEELIIVNQKYSKKIEELTGINNDINNFLSSTNIGTMLLDNSLTIKRFTPSIQETINVMYFDIGRPINHISHNLKNINVVKESQRVLDTLTPITRESQSLDGRWYVLRFLPYKTSENLVKGITITSVDITELKKATEGLKKLSQAIEQSSNVVIITDTLGNIEYVNENFTRKTGYTKEEIIGKTPKILKSNTNNDSFYDSLLKTIETGEVWVGDVYNLTKRGESFWEYTTISPVRNEDGKITNYVAIKEDVTKQKEIVQAIKNSEKKFRLLFNKANDAIFLYGFNAKGTPNKIIEVNDIACEILGYSRGELKDMSHFDLVSEKSIIDIPNIQKNLLNDGYVTYEIDYISKNGDIIPVEVNSHVFMMMDKKVVLSIARDVSMRRKNQELQYKLEEEEKLLKESLEYDRIKTEFFSNLSHELRTPINVVFGTLQILELTMDNVTEDSNTNKASRHLKILRQNCYRLMRLVNNLIDITKIDAGFFEMSLQNCNIVNVVEDIALSVAEYIENKSLSLIFDTDVEEKVLACDPNQIERILLNLLSNSVKFTEPGGQIMVELKEKEESILLNVEDTGIGIPKDKLNIIFDRFRQVDKSLTRNHEGSGIGLSIVKSLVDMNGGKIDVKSKEGIGTKFTVELPIKTVDEEISNHMLPIDSEEIKHKNIERINIEFSDIYS